MTKQLIAVLALAMTMSFSAWSAEKKVIGKYTGKDRKGKQCTLEVTDAKSSLDEEVILPTESKLTNQHHILEIQTSLVEGWLYYPQSIVMIEGEAKGYSPSVLEEIVYVSVTRQEKVRVYVDDVTHRPISVTYHLDPEKIENGVQVGRVDRYCFDLKLEGAEDDDGGTVWDGFPFPLPPAPPAPEQPPQEDGEEKK